MAADGTQIITETVYDTAGRAVATRVGTDPWTCTTYDQRDRPLTVDYPAFGGQPARTVSYDYAVGGDPLTSRTTDAAGSTTTVVDLDGRVVSYTDVSGATTATVYDQAGRATSSTTTVGVSTSTVAFTYDDAGRVTSQSLDGQTVASPTYTPAGELATVAYGNSTSLSTVARDEAGALTSVAWALGAGRTVTDIVTRSRAGRVLTDTVDDTGVTVASYSYVYDTAGRLASATIPHHQLTYHFDPSGGCGAAAGAGTNTNRTALDDVFDGAPAVSTTYCYDAADRLTSSSGATAVTPVYDSHGNTTSLAGDTLGFDIGDRHVSTTTAAGVSIVYVRDASDRLVTRTVSGSSNPDDNGTTYYAYSGDGDSADLILDAAGALAQRELSLPGGVLLTRPRRKQEV